MREERRKLEEEPLIENAFSYSQISKGAFLLYFMGIAFSILAQHRLTETYFMTTIETIIEKYNIRLDVAAATLMAIGNSAPEIFVSFFSVLLINSDLGLGTILGSGAFNSMFLIGICGVVAPHALSLQWWPLLRDFVFYQILLALLAIFTWSGVVKWWHAFLMILVYIMYTIFMFFNTSIEKFAKRKLGLPFEDERNIKNVDNQTYPIRRYSITTLKPYLPLKLNYSKGVLGVINRNTFIGSIERKNKKLTKLREISYYVIRAIEEKKRCDRRNRELRQVYKPYSHDRDIPDDFEQKQVLRRSRAINMDSEENQLPEPHRLAPPEGLCPKVYYFLMLPFELLFWVTIPNVKKRPGLWPIAFLNSIAWIGICNLLIVWWSHTVALAFTIPESVIGITVVAVGTSIPDIATNIAVTREGHANMALSGSLGSNILNIGFGLGVPWIIVGGLGDDFQINTEVFFISVITLIVILVCILTFIAGFKWMLSRPLGSVMFFFYVVFLVQFLTRSVES